jgi:hypothetical protein
MTNERHCLLARAGGEGFKTMRLKHGLAHGKDMRLVINDQHANRRACGELTRK